MANRTFYKIYSIIILIKAILREISAGFFQEIRMRDRVIKLTPSILLTEIFKLKS